MEREKEGQSVRGNVEQAWVNRRKVISAAIRLRYAIEADNEINRVLDEERKKFNKEVLQGRLPAPLDTKKSLGA
jgi:hypothetical protein